MHTTECKLHEGDMIVYFISISQVSRTISGTQIECTGTSNTKHNLFAYMKNLRLEFLSL